MGALLTGASMSGIVPTSARQASFNHCMGASSKEAG